MKCVVCHKSQDQDICYDCQADGNDHPLPTDAWIELERRRRERRENASCITQA